MDEAEIAVLQQILDVPIKELVRFTFYRNYIQMGRSLQWIQEHWEIVERNPEFYERWVGPAALALQLMQLKWVKE